MNPDVIALLRCPHCRDRFSPDATGVGCPAGHHFDLARSGYLNLLGGPQPANADTPAMVLARSRVLGSGLFDSVRDAVTRASVGPRILEAGAGTGFYLQHALGGDLNAIGIALDISTAAARVAASSDQRIGALIADVWKPLPIAAGCLNTVLTVFAPRNIPEFARMLRPDGRLVIVTPNPGHLAQLRRDHGLLGIAEEKGDRLQHSARQWFQIVDQEVVQHRAELKSETVTDLIAMGPNAFHRIPDQVPQATVILDVTVTTMRPLPL